MTIAEAYTQIDKYLDSNSHSPIVVDVTDGKLMTLLVRRYDVRGKNEIISAGEFCKGDNMPLIPNLKHAITTSESNVFLTDYSTYLKLLGKEELQMQLKSLLTDTIVGGKLVIFTYNCRKYMDLSDKRLTDAKKIIFVGDEPKDTASRIYLVASKLPFVFDRLDKYSDGLSQLPPFIEKSMLNEEDVFMKSSYNKNDFQQSLLDIRDVSSSYEVITSFCDSIKMLEKKNGTEEQWDKLLSLLQDEDFDWINLVHKKIGSETALANNLLQFNGYSDTDKWIYFLALKCFGAKDNDYLSRVISKSNNIDKFISELYDSILEMDCDDSNFSGLYKERKKLLLHFPENSNALISYCKKVTGKDKFTLYYLTDATKLERELIIKCIGDFSKEYGRTKTEQALQSIYPALYSYLSPYNYSNKFNEYFDLYKYSKIVNGIDERFARLAEEQITKRDFLMEPTRAFIIDKIEKKNTYLYFMDAMGVEFLSYIQHLCYKHRLDFSAQIGSCNLPSITIQNKDFIADFTNCGCPYSDVKYLDEIKHDGQLDYDYEKVKQPIHLAEELSILDKVIAKVDSQLQQGSLEKVVLVSDHGASRMAVIAESENKWEMSEKGQHSGRCCPVSEIDKRPDCSIEENGFWCLLNYDRFKGSRKANVEVHGGASLEEVLVPIIEITKRNQTIECRIENDYKVITSSFKKKAIIKFYISKTFENVFILVDEKLYYRAIKEMGKDYIYEVEMPEVKKTGIHTFDVLIDNGFIAKGLSFELKKEGASERKFF